MPKNIFAAACLPWNGLFWAWRSCSLQFKFRFFFCLVERKFCPQKELSVEECFCSRMPLNAEFDSWGIFFSLPPFADFPIIFSRASDSVKNIFFSPPRSPFRRQTAWGRQKNTRRLRVTNLQNHSAKCRKKMFFPHIFHDNLFIPFASFSSIFIIDAPSDSDETGW